MNVEKKLYRSCKNKVIAGVCGGVSEYFKIDAVVIRLALILITIASFGTGIVFYVFAWVLIPENPACEDKKEVKEEIKEKAEEVANEIKKSFKNKDQNSGRIIFGSILLILGIIFLVQNIIGFDIWHNFWPILIIAIGFALIIKSVKN